MPLILIIIILISAPVYPNEEDRLFDLLRHSSRNNNPEDRDTAKERLYLKNDIMFCTGNGRAAVENNRAAALMESGRYDEAAKLLLSLKEVDALFFPFIYNLGICNIFLNDLKSALMYFEKARELVPQYSRPYLQLGYIYQRLDKDSEAVLNFRESIRRNPKDLKGYILIGDVYFKRNQLIMAKKQYETVLKFDHRYPDGLLGLAKIHFKRNEFVKSLILLKSIKTEGDYDKALHYYYAETSFKLKDYDTAVKEYEKLLGFQNDKFFLTTSTSLIKHKLELSKNFIFR